MDIVKFFVKLIYSGIYIILTKILKSLAKQQKAYLVHQACGRRKGTNQGNSVEHFSKWYLYGSLNIVTLQRWPGGLSKSTCAAPRASQTCS